MLELHPARFALLSSLLLPTLLDAQTQTFISPAVAATVEGTRNNAAPWILTVPHRYLQIHSDLIGTPKIITKLGFRRDTIATNGTGTRAVDLELFMGSSVDWNQARFLISSNYTGPRTQVFARKTLTLGPLVGTTTPPPCEITVMLDTPYVYTGVTSFAWEAVTYSNAPTGTFPITLDAESGSTTLGTSSITGPGCVATGQTSPMIHTLVISDVAGGFSFGGYVDFAPKNAPTLLYLGSSNPSLTVPGLCSALYTNLLIVLPLGLTDATGFLGSTAGTAKIAGGAFAFALPNTFQGATIYTQVLALDVQSTQPFPVANSDGRVFTVPTTNASKLVQVTRVYNTDGGTNTEISKFFDTSSVGFALVTEFTY